VKCLDPPSGLSPKATAIASIKVDLPDPFSPTKKVTLGCNSISFSFTMAGIEKGYSSNDVTLFLFKATSNMY